jgi:hypothetical protein
VFDLNKWEFSTMTLWTAKSTGILFGGVTDEDTGEETLESVFWNDLWVWVLAAWQPKVDRCNRNGYQIAGKGKWVSMTLKRPKSRGKADGKKKNQVPTYKPEDHGESDDDEYTEVRLCYSSTGFREINYKCTERSCHSTTACR